MSTCGPQGVVRGQPSAGGPALWRSATRRGAAKLGAVGHHTAPHCTRAVSCQAASRAGRDTCHPLPLPPAGKTLVARALAAQASQGAGQPVAFFMRKGADVLSKWCVRRAPMWRPAWGQPAGCTIRPNPNSHSLAPARPNPYSHPNSHPNSHPLCTAGSARRSASCACCLRRPRATRRPSSSLTKSMASRPSGRPSRCGGVRALVRVRYVRVRTSGARWRTLVAPHLARGRRCCPL